jgi:hypothetical protein
MYIKKEVYQELQAAHLRTIAAMNDTIKAKDALIESLRQEIRGLEGRIEFHRAKAAGSRKVRAIKWKPADTTATDSREELQDNRDEENYRKSFPEE